jgi:hypothetical protein
LLLARLNPLQIDQNVTSEERPTQWNSYEIKSMQAPKGKESLPRSLRRRQSTEEKLTAFLELDSAILDRRLFALTSTRDFFKLGVAKRIESGEDIPYAGG